MWVLLFLLSILVNLKSRWKILAVARYVRRHQRAGLLRVHGGVAERDERDGARAQNPDRSWDSWLIPIGAVHVKDFFAFKQGVSFSIPESAKPGIACPRAGIVMAENIFGADVGAMTLAVLVNILELLCTAGLPGAATRTFWTTRP